MTLPTPTTRDDPTDPSGERVWCGVALLLVWLGAGDVKRCSGREPFGSRETEARSRARPRRIRFVSGLLLAALLLLIPTALLSAPGRPLLDEFGRGETGADGSAWTCVQLDDGRLFFGFDTVVEYDGARWISREIPGTYAVRAIEPTSNGRLWIGAMNEVGYLRPRGNDYEYVSLTHRLPAAVRGTIGDVWHVFAEGDGAVFVAKEHVLRWNGDSFEVWHLPGGRRLAGFRFADRVHLWHQLTGLHRLSRRGLEKVPEDIPLGEAGIMWMGNVGTDVVIATTHGLLRRMGDTVESFAPALDSWIQRTVLTSVVPLRSGGLAIGTLRGGIAIVNRQGQVVQVWELGTDLPVDSVYSLYEDRESFLWVTSPSGVLRIAAESAIAVYQPTKQSGFRPVALASLGSEIVAATKSGLWKTTRESARDDGELIEVPALRSHAFALLDHPSGTIVAHRNGVGLLRPDQTLEPVYASRNDVLTLAYDVDGRSIIAAESMRLVRISPDGGSSPLGTLPDLPSSIVALDHALLAGTFSRGVAILGDSSPAFETLQARLNEEHGAAFVCRTASAVVAVRGPSVVWARDSGTETVALVEGFRPSAMTARGDDVWIAGERRINSTTRLPLLYHLTRADNRVHVRAIAENVLSRMDGIASLHTRTTPDGVELWIGGETAVVQLAAAGARTITVPAPPRLRVSANALPDAGDLVLPYRGNWIEAGIAWPEPGRRRSLLLQTLLTGTDSHWSEPLERTAVRLGNLQHGTYELRARFVTADGQTSPTTVLPFRVAAPWWLTPWALCAEAALTVALILGVVKLRERRLRRHAERLERLVEQRTALLTHANQAKTEFVAKMSHELRNPLNGIVASAHALEARGIANEQHELVSTMRQCAQLLDALIGDVLDFSEIESGRITLRPTDFDPAQLAATAIAMLSPLAVQKGLRIELEVADKIPAFVHGDASRVQQVLLNLLGNALKFSSAGTIRVLIAPTTDSSGDLGFTVTDEGPGIPAGEQHLLFEKFARLSDAQQRKIPGTGLGLAVCRQLVERMGGSIWLERTSVRGAAFSFRLPLPPAGSGPGPMQIEPSASLPRSALVVEDLAYNARAMVAMLAPMGCHARTASNAAEALAILRESQFDAVFMDCDLPDMNGPDLARAILALPEQSVPPLLIATTAYADESTRAACLSSGMQAFISKPVSPDKIRAAFTSSAGTASLSAPSIVLPHPSATTAIDTRLLQVLASDAERLREQAGRLEDMMRADLAALRSAAARADFGGLHSIAHRLISHARFIGAETLAAMASEVQRAAREDPAAALEMVPVAEAEAHRVLQQLATSV